MKMIIISLAVFVVGIVLLPMFGGGSLVSKVDFENNIKGLSAKVDQMVSDVTAKKNDIDKTIVGIPNTVNTLVNQVNSQVMNNINQLSGKVDNINKDNQGYSNRITDLSNKIVDLSVKIEKNDKNLADNINELQKKNSDLETKIKTLETKIMATPTPTPNTTSGFNSSGVSASDTYNGLAATVTSNYASWSGLPLLTLYIQQPTGGNLTAINVTNGGSGYTSVPSVLIVAPITNGVQASAAATVSAGVITSITVTNAGTGYNAIPSVTISGGGGTGATAIAVLNPIIPFSTSAQFMMQLNNANAFTCSNVQLAVGLALVDNTGNQITYNPTWINPGRNLTVSSFGAGTGWTYVQTITPNTYIFSNSSPTSPFSFGQMAIAPNSKSSTYTLNVTFTNDNPAVSQTIYMYPMVKILSYQ